MSNEHVTDTKAHLQPLITRLEGRSAGLRSESSSTTKAYHSSTAHEVIKRLSAPRSTTICAEIRIDVPWAD